MKETQARKILNHLKYQGRITPIDALSWYGCFRLGARIFELKRRGYKIDSEVVAVQTRDGGTARVKAYWLEDRNEQLRNENHAALGGDSHDDRGARDRGELFDLYSVVDDDEE